MMTLAQILGLIQAAETVASSLAPIVHTVSPGLSASDRAQVETQLAITRQNAETHYAAAQDALRAAAARG